MVDANKYIEKFRNDFVKSEGTDIDAIDRFWREMIDEHSKERTRVLGYCFIKRMSGENCNIVLECIKYELMFNSVANAFLDGVEKVLFEVIPDLEHTPIHNEIEKLKNVMGRNMYESLIKAIAKDDT